MKPFKAQVSHMTRSTEIRELLGGCDLKGLLNKAVINDSAAEPGTGIPVHQYISYYGLGSTVHAGIEAVTEGELTLGEAIEEGQIHLMKEMDRHPDIIFTKARPDKQAMVHAVDELITNWWLDAHPDSDERLSYYKGFEWPPRTEITFLDEEFKISSQADALFEIKPEALSNTSHAIVDYKSGMGKNDDSMQLWIYWWLAKRAGMVPADAGFFGFFHHVTHRSVQIADPYPGDTYIEAVIRKVHGIKESRSYLPNKGWYCKYCPFQDACPAFDGPSYEELLDMIEIEYV